MDATNEQSVTENASLLESTVEVLKTKLERALKRLSKAERRIKKSRLVNEDLRLQVERLNNKLLDICQHMQRRPCVESAVQTGDCEVHVTTAPAHEIPGAGRAFEYSINNCSTVDTGIAVAAEPLHEPQPQNAEPLSITEAVRTAAEEAVRQCGMVYDEASGYYYDQSTDLYYHPESQLYFDQKNGAYYYFDQTTQEYVFHSQLESSQHTAYTSTVKSRTKRKRKRAQLRCTSSITDNDNGGCAGSPLGRHIDDATGSAHPPVSAEREDGELSDSCGSESAESCSSAGSPEPRPRGAPAGVSKPSTFAATVPSVPSGWPPCIRAIVLKSSVLKPGALYIITYPGGSIGLDKDVGHVLVLPDVGISKIHAQITYDQDEKGFFIEDLGSTNGTYVNGHQLTPWETFPMNASACGPKSIAKAGVTVPGPAGAVVESVAADDAAHTETGADEVANADAGFDASSNGTVVVGAGKRHSLFRLRLSHRDVVRFATCELLIHIHPSTDTCDECEPGVILHRMGGADVPAPCNTGSLAATVSSGSKTSVEASRRLLMKKIKQKYGLEKEAFQQPKVNPVVSKYTDRAHLRRKLVGSDNPHVPETATVASSVDRAISPDNKGHRLLKKMGWKSGEVLGRTGGTGGGIVEPVKATIRLNAAAGLGAETAVHASLDDGGQANVLLSKVHVRMKTRERFDKLK